MIRFSSRLLLLVTAIIAVCIAYVVNNRSRQIAAIRTIEHADARILYDWQLTPVYGPDGKRASSLISYDPKDIKAPIWLRMCLGDELFQQVVRVHYLHPNEVDEELLAALDSLPALQSISMYNDPGNKLSDNEVAKAKQLLIQRYSVPVYGPFDYLEPPNPQKEPPKFPVRE